MAPEPLLSIRGLVKEFVIGEFPQRQVLAAVDGVDLDVGRGETVALVGESGSGKSTLARCALRLIPPTAGKVLFDGVEITGLKEPEIRRYYRRMQMVFQDPNSSLNPLLSVRDVLHEPLKLHLKLNHRAREQRARELVELVGLTPQHLSRYPHQLSGGQRQRVGIARAIATNPDLVILDEPTSSLDVSVRGQILQLLRELQERLHLSYLLISHDLSVVRQVAGRVAVMYLGKIVEEGPTAAIFEAPEHPYTRALMSAVPQPAWEERRQRLRLEGEIPSPLNLPAGCRLQGRCPWVIDICRIEHPPLYRLAPQHLAACYVAAGVTNGAGPSRDGGGPADDEVAPSKIETSPGRQ
jgi:oligopeptide/dipeptide ABC transporter ATP-binding protein